MKLKLLVIIVCAMVLISCDKSAGINKTEIIKFVISGAKDIRYGNANNEITLFYDIIDKPNSVVMKLKDVAIRNAWKSVNLERFNPDPMIVVEKWQSIGKEKGQSIGNLKNTALYVSQYINGNGDLIYISVSCQELSMIDIKTKINISVCYIKREVLDSMRVSSENSDSGRETSLESDGSNILLLGSGDRVITLQAISEETEKEREKTKGVAFKCTLNIKWALYQNKKEIASGTSKVVRLYKDGSSQDNTLVPINDNIELDIMNLHIIFDSLMQIKNMDKYTIRSISSSEMTPKKLDKYITDMEGNGPVNIVQ